LHSGHFPGFIICFFAPDLFISLRKFSAVKYVIIIAPHSLHPRVSAALKLVVDEFIERPPPAITQPQIPRWKADDGSYRMKLMKAHALSLVQFEKVNDGCGGGGGGAAAAAGNDDGSGGGGAFAAHFWLH
jgi:hypothetical protein